MSNEQEQLELLARLQYIAQKSRELDDERFEIKKKLGLL
jgi:hypothetical protein